MITREEIERLKELAQKATPKTMYTWEEGAVLLGETGNWASIRGVPSHSASLAGMLRLEDTNFITHANPDTVTRLIEALEVATEAIRDSIARSDDVADSWCSQPIREALRTIYGDGK